MHNLAVNYCGLELRHPVIAASAGTTMNYERCRRAEEAGFSAVILKSVQEERIMRYNPNPRFQMIHEGIPGYSSDTLYSYEQAYEKGLDEYCEDVARCKNGLEIPTIASINCITPEQWGVYAKACEEAGADALEIVASCPSGLLMRSGQDAMQIAMAALLEVKRNASIPVSVKMTMQLTNPLQAAVQMAEAGADTLTLFNRFTGLDIDIDTMAPILHGGFAGHGGPWNKQLNMRWMIAIWPHLGIPISATGGVTRSEDIIKYMLCGASTVQVASLLYLKGYDCVTGLVAGLERYMDKHRITALSDIIGRASSSLVDNFTADRSRRFMASADKSKCSHCKKCDAICIYDALVLHGDGPEVDAEKCDGCNLCVSLCKTGALTIHAKT